MKPPQVPLNRKLELPFLKEIAIVELEEKKELMFFYFNASVFWLQTRRLDALIIKAFTPFLTKTQLKYFGLQHFHTPNCLILW